MLGRIKIPVYDLFPKSMFSTLTGQIKQTSSFAKLDYLLFGLVVLLGCARLAEPLWGDQSLFMLGGAVIHDGGQLYRDFWDLKPPGIYGLYALAGWLFGFTSVGMHLVELIWMVSLAIVLRLTLVPYFRQRWIVQLLPWLTVGSYFALIDARQQMQVEVLVGLPLYLTIWLTAKAAEDATRRWRWLMLSGIAAGCVVLFKLFFLPLIIAFWGVYWIHGIVQQKRSWIVSLLQTIWPLAIGLILPLLPVLIYWYSQGLIDDMVYALITYPPLVVQEKHARPLIGLGFSMGWFIRQFLPLLLLASAGIYPALRRSTLLTTQLFVWLVLGFMKLLLQNQSWWTYHFLLLLVPVAVFAALGMQWIVSTVRMPEHWAFPYRQFLKIGLTACLTWLVVANLLTLSVVAGLMLQTGLPTTAAAQRAYQLRYFPAYPVVNKITPLYQSMQAIAQFVQQPNSVPGDIYVIGNPAIYWLSDRRQAIPHNGWSPEMILQSQWSQVILALRQNQPGYIYVEKTTEKSIPENFNAFLSQSYRAVQQSDFGTWYQAV